jgi:hypothetical protein
MGTMGKMYIWKNSANLALSGDNIFYSNHIKTFCVGAIPCSFCALDYASGLTQCATEGGDTPYLANWNFDFDDN